VLLAIYDDERFIRNDTFKQHCIGLFVLHLVQLQRSLHVYVESTKTEVVQLHCIAKRHEVLIASCHRQQHVGNNTPMRVIAASVAEYQSHTIRYDTRCYFNVRSKADISQLNLPHGTDN